MSFTLMAKVMPMNVGNLAKKMVLLKLADQANDDGLCWPSYQTIAEACQVSRRTVIRHIKSLEADGFLTITKTYDKANKKNFSNKYQLTLDRGVKLPLVTESHHPSDTVSISGDTVSPKPIIKPINEPINTIVTEKSEADLLVDFWNDNRPPSAAVKKEVWSKIIKTRLKTFSADEIKTAMLTVINSQWHQQNKQVLIKNAIDSDKRCAEAIEKSSQPQQTNNQGNNHENHQSANSQPSHFDKLRAEIAAKYGTSEQPRDIRTVSPATRDDDEYV